MCAPKPPPAPDYSGAVKEQGQQNLQAAQTQTQLNRPNQQTPWGSQTWSQDPNNPNQWTSNIQLDPSQQGLLNSQNALSQNMADVAQQNVGRVGQAQSQPFNTSGLPALQGAPDVNNLGADRQKYEDAMMARQNTAFGQQTESLKQQLANQGVTPGSDAYNRAFQPLNQAQVDAQNQAYLGAGQEQSRMFGLGLAGNQFGNQARQQGLQEQSFLRSQPLNELNALRTGSQVSAPQFSQYNNAGTVMPPPTFQGVQAGYNAANNQFGQNSGMFNNLAGGLFGLGSTAMNIWGP